MASIRSAVFVTLIAAIVPALAGAQRAPELTMRLQFPDGTIDDITGLHSGRALQIQFLYRQEYYTFQLTPRLVARGTPDRVAVVVRQDDHVVADLYLAEGQDPTQTGTSPSFGVAVVGVDY